MRIVVVVSTDGSVMNALLGNAFFKSKIFSVVSDRKCKGIEKAIHHGVKTKLILTENTNIFMDSLLKYLKDNKIDYVISFFERIYKGKILECYKDKLINLHPSILPAFQGLSAFDRAISYGVKYLGSTIHFIDEGIDTGKIIMQTICPLNGLEDVFVVRHKIFIQQCKSLLQVVKWLDQGRIKHKGRSVSVDHVKFDNFEFTPSLDFVDAIQLDISFDRNVFR